MAITSGFFGSKPLAENHNTVAVVVGNKPQFINMGGGGDCGCRAIAVGLIDNALTKPRSNQTLLAKVLKHYKILEEQYKALGYTFFPIPTLNSPAESIEYLKQLASKPESMAKFIPYLALTLRQMAVDRMDKAAKDEENEEFDLYRGAFIIANEGTSPEMMRKPTTWIDECVIAASSNVLEVAMTNLVVEDGKELPLRLDYSPINGELAGDKIVMRLKDKHYVPLVHQVALFQEVAKHAIHLPPPPASPTLHSPVDLDLSEILARIKKEDERIVHSFEQHRHRLEVMVIAGELNKDDLLSIYIKGMGSSDYLRGRIKYVGMEHGHQRFFEHAINNAKGMDVNVSLVKGTYDEQLVKELVHALARAITIGQLNESQVFAQLEQDESASKAMRM